MRLVLTLMPPVPFSDTQRGRVRHPAFGPNPVRVLLSSSSQIRASSVTLAEAPIPLGVIPSTIGLAQPCMRTWMQDISAKKQASLLITVRK